MNGLSLLALVAAAIAIVIAYRIGRIHATRHAPEGDAAPSGEALVASEAEVARLREHIVTCEAHASQLAEFAEERRTLLRELGEARMQLARFRQIVVDIENNAPPPILGGPGTPDDLKLIVGIGPVLERMLQQLGIATYRQIARWTEHDIDEMDARLPEFPGRIRRDAWVTQARALHQSKYGERA
jgi:predicted flap endonuclease-1-like 5' DNA nuclease